VGRAPMDQANRGMAAAESTMEPHMPPPAAPHSPVLGFQSLPFSSMM